MRMYSVNHGVKGMYAKDSLCFEKFCVEAQIVAHTHGRRRRKDDDQDMEYGSCGLLA